MTNKIDLIFISVLTFTVLIGTVYSLYFDTWQDTSSSISATIKSNAYFAKKNNVFNKFLVKKAWGWTSLSLLSLLLTSPNIDRTTSRRWNYLTILRWIAGTSSWYLLLV